MKTETSSRPMPKTFRLCVKTDCPCAAECLRSIALAMVSPDEQSIQIINPVYLATVEGDCPVFRSAEKVRYARGFVKMLSGLTVSKPMPCARPWSTTSAMPATSASVQASASLTPLHKSTYAKRWCGLVSPIFPTLMPT